MYLDNPNKEIRNELSLLNKNIMRFDDKTSEVVFALLFRSYEGVLSDYDKGLVFAISGQINSGRSNNKSASERLYNKPKRYKASGKEIERLGVGKHVSQVNIITKQKA